MTEEFCPAPEWCYWLAIGSTAIIAVAQPFLIVLPTKLAAQWFPSDQRVLANSFASLANPLGIMMASLLAPLLCKEPNDLKFVQIYFMIPTFLAAFMSILIRHDGLFPPG